jgi:hypothetical protein
MYHDVLQCNSNVAVKAALGLDRVGSLVPERDAVDRACRSRDRQRSGSSIGETTRSWSADGSCSSKNRLWREGVADLTRIATSSRWRREGVRFRNNLRVDNKVNIDAYC